MYLTLLYYCYTNVSEPDVFAVQHLKYCKQIGLTGRIIVAREGLNGTVSGLRKTCMEYMDYIHSIPAFKHTQFKVDEVEQPSFIKMHVRHKSEIVHSGLKEKGIDPTKKTGKHVSPQAFLSMKDEEDTVVVDVRSNYEHSVGKFNNAVTLDIGHFRDFPKMIDQLSQYKDKKVITYCTGGIKCEKASAYMISQGFKHVYQLEGGIINYGKKVGGKDFEGKCYVFDNRVVVDVNTVNPAEIGRCKNCCTTSSKMINCANPECNEHFVQCEDCGWKMNGCCSESCMNHERVRAYDGTGYYVKEMNNYHTIEIRTPREIFDYEN